MTTDLRELLLDAAPPLVPPHDGLADAQRRARAMRRRSILSSAVVIPVAVLVLLATFNAIVRDDDRVKTIPADHDERTTSTTTATSPSTIASAPPGGAPRGSGTAGSRRPGDAGAGPARSEDQAGNALAPQQPVPPTERRIAYRDSLHTWTMRLDGSDRRKVHDWSLDLHGWSPDGTKLLVTGPTERWSIATIDVRSGWLTTIVHSPDWDYFNAAFSSDGTRIAYTGSPHSEFPDRGEQDGYLHLFIANADGTNQREVAGGGERPTWSPDGRKLLYACGTPAAKKTNTSVCLTDVTGDVEQAEPQGVPGQWYPPFSWSPDGRWIAGRNLEHERFQLFRPDGSAGPVVGLPSWGLARPAWTPDSRRIVYVRQVYRSTNGFCPPGATCDEPPGIYSSAIDGSGHVRLTVGDSDGTPVIPLG